MRKEEETGGPGAVPELGGGLRGSFLPASLREMAGVSWTPAGSTPPTRPLARVPFSPSAAGPETSLQLWLIKAGMSLRDRGEPEGSLITTNYAALRASPGPETAAPTREASKARAPAALLDGCPPPASPFPSKGKADGRSPSSRSREHDGDPFRWDPTLVKRVQL